MSSGGGERGSTGEGGAAEHSSEATVPRQELEAALEEVRSQQREHAAAMAQERASSLVALKMAKQKWEARVARDRAAAWAEVESVARRAAERAVAATFAFCTPLESKSSGKGESPAPPAPSAALVSVPGGEDALAHRVAALLRGDDELVGDEEAEQLWKRARGGGRGDGSPLSESQRRRLHQRVVARELATAAARSACAEAGAAAADAGVKGREVAAGARGEADTEGASTPQRPAQGAADGSSDSGAAHTPEQRAVAASGTGAGKSALPSPPQQAAEAHNRARRDEAVSSETHPGQSPEQVSQASAQQGAALQSRRGTAAWRAVTPSAAAPRTPTSAFHGRRREPGSSTPDRQSLLGQEDYDAARVDNAAPRVLGVAQLLAQGRERGSKQHSTPPRQTRSAAESGRPLFRSESAQQRRPTPEQRLVESRATQRHVLASMRETARKEEARRLRLAAQQEKWRAAGRLRLPPRSRARLSQQEEGRGGVGLPEGRGRRRGHRGDDTRRLGWEKSDFSASRDVEYLLRSLASRASK